MVFGEFAFFIRNDNKLVFLKKNPLKHAMFTLQHYTSYNSKVLSEENKDGFEKFSKTANFLTFLMKTKYIP